MLDNELDESVKAELDSEVTDADLDAAFQEFIGVEEVDEVHDEVHTDPKVETPPENPSRLGRKVARLENQMVSKDEFAALDKKIDSLFEKITVKEKVVERFDEFGEVIPEPIDIDKKIDEHLTHREKKEREEYERAEKEYAGGYVSQLKELLEEVEDINIAKEVYRKMITPGSKWNVRYSNNPYADVGKNFAKALKDTKASKTFSGNRGPNVPNGVNNASSNSSVVKSKHKLDDVASEYAKIVGMSEDDINEALDGEMPASLKGRF